MDYFQDIGEYNFDLIQGVDESHFLSDWRVNGEPFVLQGAEEIRVDFRRDPSYSGEPDLSLTLANGGIRAESNTMYMNFGKNTLKLVPGLYHYDVLVVKAGKRYTYVRGQMVLTGVITR